MLFATAQTISKHSGFQIKKEIIIFSHDKKLRCLKLAFNLFNSRHYIQACYQATVNHVFIKPMTFLKSNLILVNPIQNAPLFQNSWTLPFTGRGFRLTWPFISPRMVQFTPPRKFIRKHLDVNIWNYTYFNNMSIVQVENQNCSAIFLSSFN